MSIVNSMSLKKETGKRKASTKKSCPVCKTTKFREVEDGLVCKYGHKLLGVQLEAGEELGTQGARERKRAKVIIEEKKSSPAKQKSDFLQIIQFSLQVVTRCMVQELQFPPELEATVRELWFLYLSDTKFELHDIYIYEANAMEQPNIKKLDIIKKMEEEEASLYSSESDTDNDDDDDDGEDTGRVKQKIRGSTRLKWPTVSYMDILGFIYLACTCLNYPILLNDLIRWSKQGLIPYLNMQERIPTSLLATFGKHYINKMGTVPSLSVLHRQTHLFLRCFIVNCKLKFPDLNIPLYLDRFCSQFYLPAEGYQFAEYLFNSFVNKNDIELSATSSPANKKPHVTALLMSSVISAIKIMYGLGAGQINSEHVCQYNTSITKKEWLTLIRNHLNNYNNLESTNDLDRMLENIKNMSVATKASAHVADKQHLVLNVLYQNEPIYPRTHSTIKKSEQELFMLPKETNTNHTDIPDTTYIQEGRFYYIHRKGYVPEDYLDVIQLAMTILGEPDMHKFELILRKMDVHLFVLTDSNLGYVPIPEYQEYFKLK